MTTNQDIALHVEDYHCTIPKNRLSEMQQALAQAAQAGQSPRPFKPEHDLKGMVLEAWGLDLFSNRQDHALTEFHVPLATSLQTLDTFLSLIAPFVAMDKPAYFDVVCQAEDGDQEFFYHFENGKVIKEERITMLIPAKLEIMRSRGSDSEELVAEVQEAKREIGLIVQVEGSDLKDIVAWLRHAADLVEEGYKEINTEVESAAGSFFVEILELEEDGEEKINDEIGQE